MAKYHPIKVTDYSYSFDIKSNTGALVLCSHPMIIDTDYMSCQYIKTPNMALLKAEVYIGFQLAHTVTFSPLAECMLCLPVNQIGPVHQTVITNISGVSRTVLHFLEPPQSLFWLGGS